MPRKARVVVPGMPHHLTDRGTRRADVFRDDTDRLLYLELLLESCRLFLLRVWAYCLMVNHVHFIVVPDRPDSIERVFHRTNGTYSKRFNSKYGLVGHTWQERPFSCVLAALHLWNAVRYVERNPVRAGMVARAEDYRWSSARAHCNGEPDPLLDPLWTPQLVMPNWGGWLGGADDPNFQLLIRNSTFTGVPCGDDEFIRGLESMIGRDLHRKKPGPKPKAKPGGNILLPW